MRKIAQNADRCSGNVESDSRKYATQDDAAIPSTECWRYAMLMLEPASSNMSWMLSSVGEGLLGANEIKN